MSCVKVGGPGNVTALMVDAGDLESDLTARMFDTQAWIGEAVDEVPKAVTALHGVAMNKNLAIPFVGGNDTHLFPLDSLFFFWKELLS